MDWLFLIAALGGGWFIWKLGFERYKERAPQTKETK